MRGKQASKRYEYRRETIKKRKQYNKVYFLVIAAAIIVISAALFYANSSYIEIVPSAADTRLAADERIAGIEVNGTQKAYRLSAIIGAVNDVVSGRTVLLFADNGKVNAFFRELIGRNLEFEMIDGKLVDSNGREWETNGSSLAGNLEAIRTVETTWSAWSSRHPETLLYP